MCDIVLPFKKNIRDVCDIPCPFLDLETYFKNLRGCGRYLTYDMIVSNTNIRDIAIQQTSRKNSNSILFTILNKPTITYYEYKYAQLCLGKKVKLIDLKPHDSIEFLILIHQNPIKNLSICDFDEPLAKYFIKHTRQTKHTSDKSSVEYLYDMSLEKKMFRLFTFTIIYLTEIYGVADLIKKTVDKYAPPLPPITMDRLCIPIEFSPLVGTAYGPQKYDDYYSYVLAKINNHWF